MGVGLLMGACDRACGCRCRQYMGVSSITSTVAVARLKASLESWGAGQRDGCKAISGFACLGLGVGVGAGVGLGVGRVVSQSLVRNA